MLILILQLAFLIAGIPAIFSGKAPEFLVGKGFKIEGGVARLIGLLLIVPFAGGIFSGIVIGTLVGSRSLPTEALGFISIIEILLILAVAVIATIWIRSIRKPSTPEVTSSMEK